MSRFGSPWAEIGVGYPSKIGVSQKEPGFRRLYGIQDDAENLSYFHDVRKKLARFFDWGGKVTFPPPTSACRVRRALTPPFIIFLTPTVVHLRSLV